MRKEYVLSLVGLTVCLTGIITVSSCSKDEFFGLENSEYLDNSLKTEIAMSQEFADYSIACYNYMQEISQSVDTTDMEIQGVVNGKPIYYKIGSNETVKALYDALIKAYPELANADKLDIDEIQNIALSKNKALRGLAKSTRIASLQSEMWVYAASHGGTDWIYIIDDWTFQSHMTTNSAVSHVIFFCGETNYGMNGGGLMFNDGSAVSMISHDGYWPFIYGYDGATPTANFLVSPNANLTSYEIWDIASSYGRNFLSACRKHYIFNEEMDYLVFYY